MKFNFSTKGKNTTVNYEGAKAYTLTPEFELYTLAVTSAFSDTFYETTGNRLARLRSLMEMQNPGFVAKLAVYVRENMYLRSMPLVLAVEMAKSYSGNALVGKTVERIIQRADEITELLAYYQLANQRKGFKKLCKLSKQIQKGLTGAFNKFDEYQFAKYNRQADITFRDALFLAHPKAKSDEQQNIFNKIVNKELQTPYTWETELSKLGQEKFNTSDEKKIAFTIKWEELIDSKKVGYMALLRNLRNIIQANVSGAHITKVLEYLCNEKAVLSAKQLPFRYLAAYHEIEKLGSPYAPLVLEALNKAILCAAQNITGFNLSTTVLIACDVSGSMQTPVSKNSSVQYFDIGLVLAMLLQSRCRNVITGMFGDTWKIIQLPRGDVLQNASEFRRREGEVGYSTNGYLIIKHLIDCYIVVDKIMIFTDCQLWNSNSNYGTCISALWQQYKGLAPKAKLYLFNLAGYATVPLEIEKNDVHLISGWSDKVFDVLNALENGESTLTEINKIVI